MYVIKQGRFDPKFPSWVPIAVRHYLAHTVGGQPLRELARITNLHPSTILRQVRRCEILRDDPLIDAALARLGQDWKPNRIKRGSQKDPQTMALAPTHTFEPLDTDTFLREARRVLRRLREPGSVLAFADGLDKAVVVRETSDGRQIRVAVLEATVAQAMVLKDWIRCDTPGKVSRYRLTAAGRVAINDMLTNERKTPGFSEAQTQFAYDAGGAERLAASRSTRYQRVESPLLGLARRRDRSGEPFLSDDLVIAGERLREDFEISQIGPKVIQNWDRFLTGGDDASEVAGMVAESGPEAARIRVQEALRDLGPGLGDVALRCCCQLEGLETAERRMGWSARSGKIVLRIALQRLKRHYDRTGIPNVMIG